MENDPNEEKNIANKQIHVINTMEELLTNITQNSPNVDDKKLSKDDDVEIEAELRRLGYI